MKKLFAVLLSGFLLFTAACDNESKHEKTDEDLTTNEKIDALMESIQDITENMWKKSYTITAEGLAYEYDFEETSEYINATIITITNTETISLVLKFDKNNNILEMKSESPGFSFTFAIPFGFEEFINTYLKPTSDFIAELVGEIVIGGIDYDSFSQNEVTDSILDKTIVEYKLVPNITKVDEITIGSTRKTKGYSIPNFASTRY